MGRGPRRAFAAIALVLAAVTGVADARAAPEEFDVEVGSAFLIGDRCDQSTFTGCTFAESKRFLGGPALRVHRGDVIRFTSRTFHTATLLPDDADAEAWLSENAPVFGGPWSLYVPDSDEGPRGVKANNAVVVGSSAACGSQDAPCSYTGDVVSSGIFFFGAGEFNVTVDVEAGRSFWVVCLVHKRMRMRVEVIADAEESSSQTQIDEWSEEILRRDRANARRAHKRLKASALPGEVRVGYDARTVSLLAMYPRRLEVQRGEAVAFRFDHLLFEDHAVALPRDSAWHVVATEFFVRRCDLDGDGSDPDAPPASEGPPYCEEASQLEFDLGERAFHSTGDGLLEDSTDYESSGIRGANSASGEGFSVRFQSRSAADGISYMCIVHSGLMSGRIVVL